MNFSKYGYRLISKKFGWKYFSIVIPWLWDFTKRGPYGYSAKRLCLDHELTTDESRKFITKCEIIECDFEENWVKFIVPESRINKGFHAGSVVIDFSGVQANK